MSSTSHWALSRLEKNSCDLETPVRARLAKLCAEPHAHARFLNTLSLLEHIGSRKIMTSQPRPGHDTLKHLAEETRHAYFFKRAAEKLIGRNRRDESAFADASVHMYMGRLDAHIAQCLGNGAHPQCAYLYMSLIVELRAIWFYRLYQDVLVACANPLTLKSVLAEEELHLDHMEAQLSALDVNIAARTRDFSDFEDGRFRVLWRALDQAFADYSAPTMALSGS